MSKIAVPLPKPLFDTLENIQQDNHGIKSYLLGLEVADIEKEYDLGIEFLKSYANSKDTYTAYRREVERLLHWSWLIARKPIKQLNRNDIRDYLQFLNEPPKSWMATKISDRFILDEKGLRIANPDWRPFVVKVTKAARKLGKEPNKNEYQLSNKSIEAVFAILSSLFTFLQQEEYLELNPVSLIRQKKSYIQRQQTKKVTRKLSHLQWHYVIHTAEEMALSEKRHERTLFLMSAFYLLGLRISELAHSEIRTANMGAFAPDKRGLWWFTTVGKGNKVRDVAVPDELLAALKRYRQYLNLPALPHRGENTPLFPKQKGKAGLGVRQIRNRVMVHQD